jgi:hypothetical protein
MRRRLWGLPPGGPVLGDRHHLHADGLGGVLLVVILVAVAGGACGGDVLCPRADGALTNLKIRAIFITRGFSIASARLSC